ncbi:unnamed protein product, partial [Rotaria sordida]
MIFYTGGR